MRAVKADRRCRFHAAIFASASQLALGLGKRSHRLISLNVAENAFIIFPLSELLCWRYPTVYDRFDVVVWSAVLYLTRAPGQSDLHFSFVAVRIKIYVVDRDHLL